MQLKPSPSRRTAGVRAQAYKANVVAPNKHVSQTESMYKGRLLDSETYIGGKVMPTAAHARACGGGERRAG